MQDDRGSPSVLNGRVLADSSYRLPRFRTRTTLVREPNRSIVCKAAATEEARAFLEWIVEKERENAEYLQGHFDVLCGSLKDEGIIYEYLTYPSLAQRIGVEMGLGHCDRADALLDGYVRRIRSLPRCRDCPSEFLSTIAGEHPADDGLVVDCLSRGLLDLTPRNILVDDDRWVVIDNEWSFGFPAPVVFLLFRVVYELCALLQPEIRHTTDIHRPAVGLLSRRLQTYYYPEHWIKYIKDPGISFSRMLRWEAGFRRYVAGPACRGPGHMKVRPRRVTSVAPLRGEDRWGGFTRIWRTR